jgi:hypothetical protein
MEPNPLKKHDIDLGDLASIITFFIETFANDDINYYQPLIRSSVINLSAHPETLDWLANKYGLKTLPGKTRIVGNHVVGEFAAAALAYIATEDPIKPENVKKFEDKLTLSDRAKIQFTNVLMSLNGKIKDSATRLLIHASLINYYLYPETLDYVMDKYKFKERPTIVRHHLYKNKFKIMFLFAILSLAFYAYKKRKMISKKLSRSKRRSFGTRSRRSKRRSRRSKRKSRRSKRKSKKKNIRYS